MTVSMISHHDFGALRLSQFAPTSEIVALINWQFMERTWVGEAIGFSEWLRPQSSPNLLQCLALDLAVLSESTSKAVFSRLGLPLRPGMSIEQITASLGEPVAMHKFIADRTTHEFYLERSEAYNISCTVLSSTGLTYVVVSVPFVAQRHGA
jgi:hypothetical protein